MKKPSETPGKEEMKTLSQCMESLHKYGFKSDFRIEDNHLISQEGDKSYEPDEVSIVNFYRFEGESDPADSSILYAIETNDGMQGTLSDAFGTYSTTSVTDFILKVEDNAKKHQPSNAEKGEQGTT
jgi:hypothetical protein